ncbi:hypothetical protein OS242_10515 [Tumebacillus sp. DT12]|uniref:KfrA N-terminal DNA-binding domain-containing protein n=1 Tax=Tumebacillus lacus TaxID=2995335 RepID=A0ABT3X0G0_9BACL|nr:hypothetical protein [Tumebacillus lacus]MCX7570395.1 hypothetical protein [Tumebacillus lacus]
MARQSKIEQHGCQEIVAAGVRNGKSVRDIAEECSGWAGEKISHAAVQRYIDTLNQNKREVIVSNERALVNVVQQDFDVIQTNLKMANRLMARFDLVDNLPDLFEERMQELEHRIVSGGDSLPDYLGRWAGHMHQELKRKVYEMTALSKETREHMKLMVDLKERVYQFELMGEYLSLFMTIFQKHSPEAFEQSMQEVSGHPRMAQIIEQQRFYQNTKGGG